MAAGTSLALARWLRLAAVPAVLFAIIYAWPMFQILRGSLDGFDPITGVVPALKLDFYVKFLTDSYYIGVLWRTIRFSLIVTIVTAVAGYPISYFLVRSRGRLRPALIIVLLMPLVTSPVVVAYGWLVLLGSRGIINGLLIALGITDEPIKMIYTSFTLVLGLVQVLATFMVLSIGASLQSVDWSLVLAARSLGASGWRSFATVVLPLSLPGVGTGCILVFSLSMSAYAVPALIAGPQVKVMSELIYEQTMALLNWPFAGCMSIILLLSTTGVFAGTTMIGRWWRARDYGRAVRAAAGS
jgi:putative spermidine/putrescine transport system permease protein